MDGRVKQKLLEQARQRYKVADAAWEGQLAREREDLRFKIPEFQWTDEERTQRGPRPTLSISQLDQPIQMVLNQMRAANLSVDVYPRSEDATSDTAEAMQGLYRHIERDSQADLARSFAFERALICGRGVYRVMKVFDPEGGHKTDQKIVIRRIRQQDGVLFDPSAEEPDFSDGRYAFVLSWMSRDAFKSEFPNVKIPEGRMDMSMSTSAAPEWFDGAEGDVLVAEYWYREFESEDVKDDDGEVIGQRETPKVCVAKLCGWDVLGDPVEWDGQHIPLVPVIGHEEQSFDGERRWSGMVRPAMDGQRVHNYSASTLVERMALEPKTPFIGAEGQFEGHEAKWNQANNRNFPYLEYKHLTHDGKPVPPPTRAIIDQSGMSIAVMGLQESKQFIQSCTAVYDPGLGRENPRDKSGKAILALQQQGDMSTSHYLQNLEEISMRCEARIVLDLMKIYDRPGRVARVLRGDDGRAETVMLNAPFVPHPNTGQPMPAQPSAPGAKHYDFSSGAYGVEVSVGKSYQTRLEEGSAHIGEILQANPDLFMLLGDLFLKFQTWPGAKDMGKRMAKAREMKFPGMDDDESSTATPQQAQAQVQAMKAQLQAMQQQLQQASQALAMDQAKHQATIQAKQIEAQSRLAEVRMNNATKLAVARITAAKVTYDAAREDEEEALALQLQQQHEAEQAGLDRAHEAGMAALKQAAAQQTQQDQQAHEVGMAAAEPMPMKEAA